MTGHDWRDLWHRAQDGEVLSELEKTELGRALTDAQHQRQVVSWSGVPRLLRTAPVPTPPLRSLAAELAQDIALSRQLSAAPPLPHSLAAELAAQIAEDADPLSAALRSWPRPQLPYSLAASLAARVAAEARAPAQPAPTPDLPPDLPEPYPDPLPPLGRTRLNPPGGPSGLGGLGVVLAFGGLTVLRGSSAAQQALGFLGTASPGTVLPLPAALGVALLALLSWLIVARPTPAVRRLGALAFAITGVLTLPALWDALQSTPLHEYLKFNPGPRVLTERWLGAGLLLGVTAALLRGGQAIRLARRQRKAPMQTLAAGTLAGLGLSGLALLLVSFGWTALGLSLALLSALAAALGLSVSLFAVGRSVARRLHLALPEVSGALAGLLAFSASLSIPALAAGLALIGSVWGLGTLLLGREAARL